MWDFRLLLKFFFMDVFSSSPLLPFLLSPVSALFSFLLSLHTFISLFFFSVYFYSLLIFIFSSFLSFFFFLFSLLSFISLFFFFVYFYSLFIFIFSSFLSFFS